MNEELITQIVALRNRIATLECTCCFSCDSKDVSLPARRESVCTKFCDDTSEKTVERCMFFTENGGSTPVDPTGRTVGGVAADTALLVAQFGGTWASDGLANVFCGQVGENINVTNLVLD